MNLLNYFRVLYPKSPTDEEIKLRREKHIAGVVFLKEYAEQLKKKACSYRF